MAALRGFDVGGVAEGEGSRRSALLAGLPQHTSRGASVRRRGVRSPALILLTPADKPGMIDLQTPLAGMNRASASVNRAAVRIAAAPFPQGDSAGDSFNLSTEMVALMEGRTSFEANVNVAQTETQMSKSVLDILG